MKVIDIMQKVANKEIFKFRIEDCNYYVDKSNYICEEDGDKVEWYIDDEWLNMNVEIIEEDKKIEKIDLSEWAEITYQEDWKMLTKDFNRNCNLFVNKINEIIDKIQE